LNFNKHKERIDFLKSLQPLRIPKGWQVSFNIFMEIDPLNQDINNFDPGWDLSQDLLQIQSVQRDIIIDLGWYPDHDPNGEYKIFVIKNLDWENPLITYASRSKDEIVSKIERLLLEI
jgi:hypothetical protein